jgi:hypothetical protein
MLHAATQPCSEREMEEEGGNGGRRREEGGGWGGGRRLALYAMSFR